ncbi:MAG TPA: helix-turn-helix domain-containing protein [Ilumatobacteraceae bacterium]|nr:helix-turn-helix domain-containing protein [Ilumatobacteraceae bacterium]
MTSPPVPRSQPARRDAGQGTTSRPAGAHSFSAQVSALTTAFGDPTRRGIYLFAREHRNGVTAAQVAEHFGVHPNVARHHLDKLVAGGYVEVAVERVEGGGAGRPSKHYSAEPFDFPVRSDDLVLTLLARALAMLPREQAEAMAEEIGAEYGHSMALGAAVANDGPATNETAQLSFRNALHTVAEALTAHGFAAHADQRNNQLRIVNNHCPFGDHAIDNPVICAVDRGMVKGMLKALYGDTDPSIEASLPQGDRVCVTSF